MIVEQCDNMEDLRQLGSEWAKEVHADEYGIDIDVDVFIEELKNFSRSEAVVFVAKEKDDIIGMISVFAVPGYLGKRHKMAVEKYWYSRKGSHFAGPRLFMEMMKWSKNHGCTHLVVSGSRMASDSHDSICRFLEKTGARHFETTYIYNLGGSN